MVKYKIGKLNIESEFALSEAFDPFRTESATADMRVLIKDSAIDTDGASFRVTQDQFDVWKMDHAYAFRFKLPSTVNRRAAEMLVDDMYTRIAIMPGCGQEYLIRLAIECRMVKEGLISLHSSCIIGPDGNAICMTGKSGIGKSTRVAAWKRAMELEILSGDRPFIDVKGRTAGGAPWDGKEGLHNSNTATLGCILNIIRADGTEGEYDLDVTETASLESRIRILDEDEAFKVMIAQTYLPMWDTDLAARAMLSLKELCGYIKVMELISGPDEKSAVSSWMKLKECL